MGKFAPVFLAYILNCFGVNIFRENAPGCEPLVSCLIFLTAVFFLLWDMRLYPNSLRKLSCCGAFLVEFLIAAFLMEHIMTDFWFPLESSLMAFLPKIADFEDDLLTQGGWKSGGVFGVLKYNGTQVIASYVLSLFFLFAVLHATRIIDLRLLTNCGVKVFVRDILQRFKKFRKKIFRMLTRRQVKFKLNCSATRSKSGGMSSCPSSDFDDCDCTCPYDDTEGEEEEDVGNDDDCFEDDCMPYSYARNY